MALIIPIRFIFSQQTYKRQEIKESKYYLLMGKTAGYKSLPAIWADSHIPCFIYNFDSVVGLTDFQLKFNFK